MVYERYVTFSMDRVLKALELREGEEYHIRIRRITKKEFFECSEKARLLQGKRITGDIICVQAGPNLYFLVFV